MTPPFADDLSGDLVGWCRQRPRTAEPALRCGITDREPAPRRRHRQRPSSPRSSAAVRSTPPIAPTGKSEVEWQGWLAFVIATALRLQRRVPLRAVQHVELGPVAGTVVEDDRLLRVPGQSAQWPTPRPARTITVTATAGITGGRGGYGWWLPALKGGWGGTTCRTTVRKFMATTSPRPPVCTAGADLLAAQPRRTSTTSHQGGARQCRSCSQRRRARRADAALGTKAGREMGPGRAVTENWCRRQHLIGTVAGQELAGRLATL